MFIGVISNIQKEGQKMTYRNREKQIVRIRRGLNGWQVSQCDKDGRFVQNAESIDQIKAKYEYETKNRKVKKFGTKSTDMPV